ncbi:MAG: hypothetical protein K5886_07840, partial [Lachnospiraceae bacterium]|nr:hypothetical protein [Lachnospiraceae bacterium]
MKKIGLTALTELWNGDDVVLLGDWCLTCENRKLAEDKGLPVMKHSYDRESLSKTYDMLTEFTGRLIDSIGKTCNEYFGQKHDHKYWQGIYEVWMRDHICIWYQRYKSLIAAYETYGSFETDVYAPLGGEYPIADVYDPPREEADYYNLLIYERILDIIKDRYGIKVNVLKDSAGHEKLYNKKSRGTGESKKPDIKNLVYRTLFGSSKIRGIDTVLGTDPKKVKYKTLGRCFWDWGVFTDVKVTSRERDMELRRALKPDLKPENEFEEIMIENIMYDIPIAVIEGYRESYDNLKKLSRHMPESVITYGSGGTNPGGIVLSWLSENGVEINSIY